MPYRRQHGNRHCHVVGVQHRHLIFLNVQKLGMKRNQFNGSIAERKALKIKKTKCLHACDFSYWSKRRSFVPNYCAWNAGNWFRTGLVSRRKFVHSLKSLRQVAGPINASRLTWRQQIPRQRPQQGRSCMTLCHMPPWQFADTFK